MKPGRELDLLVAEHIFNGAHIVECARMTGISIAPNYSTDIAAAWKVVEEMGCYFQLHNENNCGSISWITYFAATEYVEADTAPQAICLAALKTKGVQI